MSDKCNFRRDQNGVVWFGFANPDGPQGMTTREGYEQMRERAPGLRFPPYDDLELWDSHEQNIVDVD